MPVDCHMAASESLLALRRRADRGHQRAPRVSIYDRWLRAHFEIPFEAEPEEVVHGSALVAAKRTWETFREWSDVDCDTVLIDTVADAIYDDEI